MAGEMNFGQSPTAVSERDQRLANLNEVLQLNARLALAKRENELLDEAVSGICRAMQLHDVTIFELHKPEMHWAVRTTTSDSLQPGHAIPADINQLLEDVRLGDGEKIVKNAWGSGRGWTADGRAGWTAVHLLRVGKKILGAIWFNSGDDSYAADELGVLTRTFAQNLSALWRNLTLLLESRQRARELEILHGRHVNQVWQNEGMGLHAVYGEQGLIINPEDGMGMTVNQVAPMRVGSQTVGQIELPDGVQLSDEDAGYIQALIREMGNALNNANLLQTARAYANQLNAATEVSRAASTILDRDRLIQEAVKLIQERFNFYYVGLFLVNERENTAVLQAGTGEAGRLQVANRHQLVVGGGSMIGAAIAGREARVEQDVTTAKAFRRNPLLPDTRSEIALPMRIREKALGALTVQSTSTGAFLPDTVTVLQSMADQLGVAIENASLFDRVQATLAETDRLYQASRRINEAADEQAVYQALVEFARDSGQVDACQIITVDPRATDFFMAPALWSREPMPYDAADRFPRDRFQFGNRLETNELIIISDVTADSNLDRLTRLLFSRNHIQSAAMIPIHAEAEWLGTLALLSTQPHAFVESDLQPFITLADQTAVILANLQLLRQTESLYRIGRELSQSLTRDDALRIAVREVAEYTGAGQCRFVLYDERQRAGRIQAESTPTPLASALRLPMAGDTIFELMKANNRPILLEDDEQTADEIKERYLRPFAARASLVIPASSQQDLIGFVALDSKRGIRPFKQTNIVFAQTVVDQLTTQIENLKLLDEALNRAQELITLNQIHSRIAGLLDMEQLAQSIYNYVGQLLDNTIFLLATYDEDKRQYMPVLSIDRGREMAELPRTLQEHDPLCQFLYSNKPLTAESILLTRPSADGPAPVSGIWVPLQQEGRPTGLISVQSYDAEAYSENDAQLLRSIGTQTSLAMANAQLFERIQASNEELRQLDLLKTQFLANMSHELRTPLNSIIGFSRVILKGIDGPITNEQQEDLTSIFNNGHHLLSLINEILDMAKIEAGKMTLAFEPVKVETVAQTALSTIRSLVDPEKVELIYDVPPNLPEIEADPVRLRQILVNLLSNAAKYTREGWIRLGARYEAGDDKLLFLVEDTGIGIAEQDFGRLFTAFEQVDNSTTRSIGGTGLGLPITRWLVNSHQGEIWLESVVGEGATFYVTLPLVRREDAPAVASLIDAPSESFGR